MDRGDNRSSLLKSLAAAEAASTGEIRVHLTRRLFEKDPWPRALRIFELYGMRRTTQANAVLIYLNLRTHRFAIVADVGLDDKIDQRTWNEWNLLFKKKIAASGVDAALESLIVQLGSELAKHFPRETA